MKRIILASSSPRRKALLEKAGLKFEVEPADYFENLNSGLEPNEMVKKLSLEKARNVANNNPGAIVIAADTIGVLGDEIIGKPRDEDDARKMLSKLSGKSHLVITGFTIINGATGKSITRSIETKVYFRSLTNREIENYVKTGEPLDKAGAYGIQGLGAALVDHIDGDYDNVVGLPLTALIECLKEFDISFFVE
jgi:septum formation protein